MIAFVRVPAKEAAAGVANVPPSPQLRRAAPSVAARSRRWFIRGDDGKEVFFHRSGLNAADYDGLSEGDTVEYVVQEGPRGARAENVRQAEAASQGA